MDKIMKQLITMLAIGIIETMFSGDESDDDEYEVIYEEKRRKG